MVVKYKITIIRCIGKLALDDCPVNQFGIALTDPFEIAGLGPISRVFNQPIFDRVGMHVTAKVKQMPGVSDVFCLERALEEGACAGEAFVDGLGVGNR
jgi:hypothetical protein